MAIFTLQVGPSGPVLDAVVAVSQPRHQALIDAGLSPPAVVPIRALVDTGASHTCIDPSVFQALGLTPTEIAEMTTPSTGASPSQHNLYDVSLWIPGAGPQHQPLVLRTLEVSESALAPMGIQALIGRDILESCLLVYNGSSRIFSLAF